MSKEIMRQTPKFHIVVIGAGVIGLQTSLSLLEAGYDVTIVAEHFPGDMHDTYTSPRAGGQWRTHALPGQEQCEWDVQTFESWKGILEDELKCPDMPFEERSGLGTYESNLYWDNPSRSPEILAAPGHNPANLWWAHFVPTFSVLSPPFPCVNIKAGVTYRSFTFNPSQYITWLFRRLISKGVSTIRTKDNTAQGLAHAVLSAKQAIINARCHDSGKPGNPVIFVNATGLGARSLVPDEFVHPVRGQTLLVRGEARSISTHVMHDGSPLSDEQIAYVVPRSGTGTSLIGGSKQVGIWDTTEDVQLSKTIVRWAKGLAPELCGNDGELEVSNVQVGLRPGRKGGPRVEKEVLTGCDESGRDLVVIHAYGHGGSGFQNSVGSARKVVGLIEEHLSRQTSA